jgi:peptide/nickel transport system ATP-binding protein
VPQAEARRQAIARLQEVKLLPNDEQLRQQVTDELKQESPDAQPRDRDIAQALNRRKQDILNRYPHELSGGQIQRVTIAMAIACDPTLLIADEPTTALDVTVQAAILNLLREIRDRRGMSMIFITHDLGVIAEIADDVAVMYQGEIVEAASVWQIFSDPQHPYTKGLLACRPQPDKRLKYLPTIADFMAKVAEDRNNPTTSDALPDTESLVDEREVSAAEMDERSRSLQAQSPLLSVNDLQVGFPIRGMFGATERYFMAVNGVSFQVYPGETLGVVGESGCGKTTLARTLLRLIDPIGGQMWFEGADITHLEGEALRHLRRDMQVIFQDPFSSLNPRMTIGAAVMEPLKIHGVGKSRRQQRDRAADLLDRVGIDPNSMNRYPHEFSGGQRQRICIARALALNPKFVICDESVSALDVSVQAQVLNLLKALQQEFGLTYIFISHDLSVVKFMSDRILVMNRGKIEEINAAERVYRQPQQPYTRQLIASIPTGSLERIRQLQEMR